MCLRPRAISYLLPRALELLLVPTSGVGKPQHPHELSASDVSGGRGSENLHRRAGKPGAADVCDKIIQAILDGLLCGSRNDNGRRGVMRSERLAMAAVVVVSAGRKDRYEAQLARVAAAN